MADPASTPQSDGFTMEFEDGSRAIVPSARVSDAFKAKGKLVQPMTLRDGTRTWVPFDKVHDTIANGGQVLPPPISKPTPPAMEQMTGLSSGPVPGLPWLQRQAAAMRQEAQRQRGIATAPGQSPLSRAGHALASTGAETGSALTGMAGGIYGDPKAQAAIAAGVVDPAIPLAYFGTQGVSGATGIGQEGPGSIQRAIQNPTPENVEQAAFDTSMAGAPFLARGANLPEDTAPPDVGYGRAYDLGKKGAQAAQRGAKALFTAVRGPTPVIPATVPRPMAAPPAPPAPAPAPAQAPLNLGQPTPGGPQVATPAPPPEFSLQPTPRPSVPAWANLGQPRPPAPEVPAEPPTPQQNVAPPAPETPPAAPQAPAPIQPRATAAPPTPAESARTAKVADFIGKSISRAAQEAEGQGVLDDMEHQGISPIDVSRQFWDETYFKLPAEVQAKFRNYLKKETTFQPGDVIGTRADKSPIVAQDWAHIADNILELTEHPADLEGTTRGLVALMKVANDRFGGTAPAGAGPIPRGVLNPPPTLPATVPRPQAPTPPPEPAPAPTTEPARAAGSLSSQFNREAPGKFRSDIGQTAHDITESLPDDLRNSLMEWVKGVVVGARSSFENRGQIGQLRAAYEPVRQLLRRDFGDSVRLYRFNPPEGSPELTQRDFLSFADKALARTYAEKQYPGGERDLVRADVPIDKIIAVPTAPGGYREFFVDPSVMDNAQRIDPKELERKTSAASPAAPPPPEPPPAPPPKTREVEQGARLNGVDGGNTTVLTPSGRELNGRYRVVDLADLTASHNEQTFAKNPKYPPEIQERTYHSSPEAQARVIEQSGEKFDPRYLLNTNPDTVNGPPVVTPDGIVLGGNSRVMTLRRLGNYDDFKQPLIDNAGQFGLDPEQIRGMKQPALVREVDAPRNVEELRRIGSDLNKPMTGALSESERAVSAGKSLTDDSLHQIGNIVDAEGPDGTLRDAMRSRPKDMLDIMQRDGVITDRQRPSLVDAQTGGLNEDGKNFIEKALRGAVIDDPDLMNRTPKSTLQKLDGSLGELAAIGRFDDNFNIKPLVRAAVEEHANAAAAGIPVVDYPNQRGLFGEGMAQNPAREVLARAFLSGSRSVRNAFRTFRGLAEDVRTGQGNLLAPAEGMTPVEAFNRAFNANLTPEEFRDGYREAVESRLHPGGRLRQ